jgi:ceramide glucosyltransferase
LRTVLSDVVVETCVDESNLSELLRHELRWLRTIRAVRPVGHALCFITFGIPVAALGSLLAAGAPPALAMLAITVVARAMLHSTLPRRESALAQLLLLPLRDTLSFALWAWSFATHRVRWRDGHFQVTRNGVLLRESRAQHESAMIQEAHQRELHKGARVAGIASHDAYSPPCSKHLR